MLTPIEDGHITLENYFLDDIRLEAIGNKYSFIWKKSTVRFEEELKEKVKETVQDIQEIVAWSLRICHKSKRLLISFFISWPTLKEGECLDGRTRSSRRSARSEKTSEEP